MRCQPVLAARERLAPLRGAADAPNLRRALAAKTVCEVIRKFALPKYALLEIERRFLVDPARLPPLDESTARRIEDLYLDGGRLRLRAVTHPDGAREFKLCKKYERADPLVGPITNLYLTTEEHAAFAGLPGRRLKKRRYRVEGSSVEVFEHGLVLAEQEAPSVEAARAAVAPSWTVREVTDDPAYTGWALAQ